MPPHHRAAVVAGLALLVLVAVAPTALAHLGGTPGAGGPYVPPPASQLVDPGVGEAPCPDVKRPDAWAPAQTIEGVEVRASLACEPDDPRWIAAFVKGTNNIDNRTMLDDVRLHPDAVTKCCDRDGDGDPDIINITLEVNEINGWHVPEDDVVGPGYAIAPGIAPGFWVFSPKVSGSHGGPTDLLARPPTPPIRVEVGDTVHLTLENTHYFPHTIHLHGVDHPFLTEDGAGNDGVPHISERPTLPGERRTYSFTARHAGTMFYHCHVHPHVHVMMGLGATFVIEEDRPDNWLQTFNIGGGEVRYPSKAVLERYDREYDLIYQDVDKELNDLIRTSNDPRVLERRMHREFDTAEGDPDYFLLNGRSYPYTLRESTVVVRQNEDVLLRVVDAGRHPVSLHTHGHKATIVARDGVPLSPEARIQQDVYTLTAAQRLDLHLNTTNDGLHSYGPGVWFVHDHQEEAVTTDGIGPGGDITVIAYEDHLTNRTYMPRPAGPSLELFFNAAYYRGEVPVWQMLDPELFGEVPGGERAPQADGPRTAPTPAVSAVILLVLAGLVAAATRGRRCRR